MPDRNPFIEVQDLTKHFRLSRGRRLEAVDRVSFTIEKGQVLGLVGESGCGKTTIGRLLLRLLAPTSGTILFDRMDLTRLGRVELRRMRHLMQIIFQDPYSSLDPRMTIGSALITPMKIQGLYKGQRRERVRELLERVGLKESDMNRYPHEFSGGQRQRIGIARALSVDPAFIVADEPVSALDVSIQSQVLNLLKDLQQELRLTTLFISHDLSVVQFISDQVAIVYMGQIVEKASADVFYREHRHPYTRMLLSAIPHPDPHMERDKPANPLKGEITSPIDPPPGCRFLSRCPHPKPQCAEQTPRLVEVGKDHLIACFGVSDAGAVPSGADAFQERRIDPR